MQETLAILLSLLAIVQFAAAQIFIYPNVSPFTGCVDKQKPCRAWTRYCHSNEYVRENCPVTCRTCPRRQTSASRQRQAVLQSSLQEKRRTAPAVEQQPTTCVDLDSQCDGWVRSDFSLCTSSVYIRQNCHKRCGYCGRTDGPLPKRYDLRELPASLEPVGFLLGKWRSEHGGKARFPTIPVFTYGEEIDFSIAEAPRFGARSLNYTAFAFGINEAKELHSEYGFLAVQENSDRAALTTVMNNGFTTVEEGPTIGNSIRLKLTDIGRISFSRDLPVHDMIREFRLIDSNTLEQTLEMETLTHPMQEHTFIRYKKIFP